MLLTYEKLKKSVNESTVNEMNSEGIAKETTVRANNNICNCAHYRRFCNFFLLANALKAQSAKLIIAVSAAHSRQFI